MMLGFYRVLLMCFLMCFVVGHTDFGPQAHLRRLLNGSSEGHCTLIACRRNSCSGGTGVMSRQRPASAALPVLTMQGLLFRINVQYLTINETYRARWFIEQCVTCSSECGASLAPELDQISRACKLALMHNTGGAVQKLSNFHAAERRNSHT